MKRVNNFSKKFIILLFSFIIIFNFISIVQLEIVKADIIVTKDKKITSKNTKNLKAHKEYEKLLRKMLENRNDFKQWLKEEKIENIEKMFSDKEERKIPKITFAYHDIDEDKVDELLVNMEFFYDFDEVYKVYLLYYFQDEQKVSKILEEFRNTSYMEQITIMFRRPYIKDFIQPGFTSKGWKYYKLKDGKLQDEIELYSHISGDERNFSMIQNKKQSGVDEELFYQTDRKYDSNEIVKTIPLTEFNFKKYRKTYNSTDFMGKIGKELLEEEENSTETFDFEYIDAAKLKHKVKLDKSLKMHPYNLKNFKKKGDKLFYEDDNYTSKLGIDVSHHQPNIDWKKVKEFGIEFAFIRIGARGYGKDGKLIVDREYKKNIKAAKKQGIKVGVYFYSQAISKKEAKEEANFVLKLLKGEKLDLPVIYDPEHVLVKELKNGKVVQKNIGRNAKVSRKQHTEHALVFMEKLKKKGYSFGIYSNMNWLAYEYDVKQIEKFPIWYADYRRKPQSPFLFEFWQYTNKGKIPGIKGVNTDMNIWLIKK